MEVCRDDKEEDVSTYWMTLRKRKNTRNWKGNTRSRSVEESIWKSPWTCRKRDHRMKQPRQEQSPDAFHTVFPASSDLRNNTHKYSRKKVTGHYIYGQYCLPAYIWLSIFFFKRHRKTYSKLLRCFFCLSEFEHVRSKECYIDYPINICSGSGAIDSFTRIFSFKGFNCQITLYGLLRYSLL